MALPGKLLVTLAAMVLLLMTAGLGLHGCAGNPAQTERQVKPGVKTRAVESENVKTIKPADAGKDALTIKPTTETAGLYSAIKDADRVVISVPANILDDRQGETVLSCFNAREPVFWDIMRAVTSANTEGDA